MGLGPSRIGYNQPPPPPLTQELDFTSEKSFHEQLSQPDPEGYTMCWNVAVKEGLLASATAMSLTGLGIFFAKKYTQNSTVQKLLNYSPGIVFLVSSAGMSVAALVTELTLHDCTLKRGKFLFQYWESLGLAEPFIEDDPNRVKKLNWNVKKKYGRLDEGTNLADPSAPKL